MAHQPFSSFHITTLNYCQRMFSFNNGGKRTAKLEWCLKGRVNQSWHNSIISRKEPFEFTLQAFVKSSKIQQQHKQK